MDKPKKVYEAREELRKDSAVLIEDIKEATAVTNSNIENLKPYLYYFSLIYPKFLAEKPNILAEIEVLNRVLKKENLALLSHEQMLVYLIMQLKANEQSIESLQDTCKVMTKNANLLYNQHQLEDLKFKELQWINTGLEDIYKAMELAESHGESLPARFIELMKKLQADFPREYAKYTLEEGEIKN
jgi:hypothetical protein